MSRRLSTQNARQLHCSHIAHGDLADAAQYIEAGTEVEAAGADPRTDPVHRALVSAVVIQYAKPFSGNEHNRRARTERLVFG
jgi:hypothetical protein